MLMSQKMHQKMKMSIESACSRRMSGVMGKCVCAIAHALHTKNQCLHLLFGYRIKRNELLPYASSPLSPAVVIRHVIRCLKSVEMCEHFVHRQTKQPSPINYNANAMHGKYRNSNKVKLIIIKAEWERGEVDCFRFVL